MQARAAVFAGALVAAVSVIGGCGSDSGGGGDLSDEDQVRETVTAFLAAVGEGDGHGACSHLADSAESQLVSNAGLFGGDTCPKAIQVVSGMLEQAEREATLNVTVGKVQVDGNEAQVPDSAITDPKGDIIKDENPAPTLLSTEDGSWLITDLG